MNRYLTLILLGLFNSAAVFSQADTNATPATSNEGDTVSVCGKVMSAEYKLSEETRPTYLVVGSKIESQMTVLINGDSRKRFDYKPEKDLLNREVCITGKIISIDGKMHIMVSKQSEIILKD